MWLDIHINRRPLAGPGLHRMVGCGGIDAIEEGDADDGSEEAEDGEEEGGDCVDEWLVGSDGGDLAHNHGSNAEESDEGAADDKGDGGADIKVRWP